MKKSMICIAAVLSLSLAGCEPGSGQSTSTSNAVSVENNQKRLMAAYPAPQLQRSQERENLIKRLNRLNLDNKVSMIYLISQGQVMATFPIKGKATSLNAFLMAGERVIFDGGSVGGGNIATEQPDYDGAYGKNDDGIFFFTADTDAYVEWKGDYMYTDQPMVNLGVQPRLTREVK